MNKNNNNYALRSQTPFMSENHPLNPYGNNFIDHPYDSKIFYKLTMLNSMFIWRRMINLEFLNIQHILVFVQEALQQQLEDFKYFQNIFEHLNQYKHLYLGLIVASSVTFMYTYLTTLYINNVSRPLLYKYLEEAKKNGFQDYEISFKQ